MSKDNRPQEASLNSESQTSHSPRAFLTIIASLLLATVCPTFGGQSVSLSWAANSEPNVAGYKVYYGSSKRDIQSIDVGNVTTATVPDLKNRTTYYFAVTAYDKKAKESDPSTKLSYKTGPAFGRTSEVIVKGGDGSGRYWVGSQVRIDADAAPNGKSFSTWAGDTSVISNPFIKTTSATVPSLDVLLKATYAR